MTTYSPAERHVLHRLHRHIATGVSFAGTTGTIRRALASLLGSKAVETADGISFRLARPDADAGSFDWSAPIDAKLALTIAQYGDAQMRAQLLRHPDITPRARRELRRCSDREVRIAAGGPRRLRGWSRW